jgi:hypothetical protein
LTIQTLEEKLQCIFADVGSQVGELVRCLIQAEVASHMDRIQQLQSVLDGALCDTVSTDGKPVDALPPA